MYPHELIDEILHKADIVSIISSYIPVIQRGRSYLAVCPFHDDTNPSLNISKEKQIFKCFSCGTGGNAISFVEKYEKISYTEAVRKVAELIGFTDPRLEQEVRKVRIDPEKTPLLACINDLLKYYQYGLSLEEGKVARDYLKARNLDGQVEKYGIGYAPKDGEKTVKYLQAKGHSLRAIEGIGIAIARNEGMSDNNAGRLIFPLYDPDGQVIGFSARRLTEDKNSPKYVNSPETRIFEKGKTLYNYHNAKRTAHHDGYVYVLEGFMDVMALSRAGIESAVALMGTALTGDQARLLRRLNCEVRLCLDGDEAGQKGMMKAIAILNKAGIRFRLVSNPGDLRDPDDILQQDGAEGLKKAMDHLVDAFDFQLNYYTNVKHLDNSEDRQKVMTYFTPFLRNMEPGIERENYIVKLSKATGYEVEAIKSQILLVKPNSATEDETVVMDQMEYEIAHSTEPNNALPRRLARAERETLFYMLQNQEAVRFFAENIENFYNNVYNQIANFVLDYVDERNQSVEVSTLLGDIGSSGIDDADELSTKISEIMSDSYHPPYTEKAMKDCAEAIKEEKERLYQKNVLDEKMQGNTLERKGELLNELAKAKRAKFKGRRKTNPEED